MSRNNQGGYEPDEVTPAMIAAGDAVLRTNDYDFWESTSQEFKADLLRNVFKAMRSAS